VRGLLKDEYYNYENGEDWRVHGLFEGAD